MLSKAELLFISLTIKTFVWTSLQLLDRLKCWLQGVELGKLLVEILLAGRGIVTHAQVVVALAFLLLLPLAHVFLSHLFLKSKAKTYLVLFSEDFSMLLISFLHNAL